MCVHPETGLPAAGSEHMIWDQFDCSEQEWDFRPDLQIKPRQMVGKIAAAFAPRPSGEARPNGVAPVDRVDPNEGIGEDTDMDSSSIDMSKSSFVPFYGNSGGSEILSLNFLLSYIF